MNNQTTKQYCEIVSALLDEMIDIPNRERLKESLDNLLDQYINVLSESVLESLLSFTGVEDYIIIDRQNLYIDSPSMIDALSKGLNMKVYHRFSADLVGDHMNEGTA